MKKLLVLLFLSTFASLIPAFAQSHVVVVDMVKVIKAYYKADIIFNQLNDEEKVFERSFQDMGTDLQKEGAQYDQLVKAAQDTTNSQPAREQKAEQAGEKKQQIVSIQETMERKRSDFVHNFQAERALKEQQLVEDVAKAIGEYAATKGFDMVMDKSGSSVTTGAPVLVYVAATVPDITEEIVAKLNAGAPKTTPVAPAANSIH